MTEPTAPEMERYDRDNLRVVLPKGRLDHSMCEGFERAMRAETKLALRGDRHVVIDLGYVTFLSSMILKVIRSQKRLLEEQNLSICLCNPTPVVREVLSIAKFELVAPLHDDVDIAAVALAGN